jgi:hypothetical protein
VGVGDRLDELVGRQSETHVDLVPGEPEFLQSRLGDLLRNQYTRHRYTFRLTQTD